MNTLNEPSEQSLTSLMKAKYGVTRSSSIKLNENDTLYTTFRKLADNIYKNGEWTKEDEERAVDTMVRNSRGFPLGAEEITKKRLNGETWRTMINIEPVNSTDKQLLGSRSDGKIVYTALVNQTEEVSRKKDIRKTFVILDPENKTGTKHGKSYYYSENETTGERIYYSLGNMNRAIGYDKLQRDILNEFDANKENCSFSRTELESLLRKLSSSEYSGKTNTNTFKKNISGELSDEFLATLPRLEDMNYLGQPHIAQELVANDQVDEKNRAWVEQQLATNWGDLSTNPESTMKVNLDEAPYILKDGDSRTFIYPKYLESYRNKNRVIDFVQEYIENTYNLILQAEYEKDIDKQTRASAWQTKKNINKETLEVMNTTSLNNYFGYVEIDNDVDLNLFQQFEAEMERIHEILPKTGKSEPDLRLRKLGNHNALGLYVPINHTIAVDFRDTGDDIGGIGIQSFIHEYGHGLDYGLSEGRLLSMRNDFKPIVARYRQNLKLNGKGSYVANKAGYYTAPTEVFARAFEIYVSDLGFQSAFLKSSEVYTSKMEYSLFDKEMREDLHAYFDEAFPQLKENITKMSRIEEKQTTVESKKEGSKNKERKGNMARTHEEREAAWNTANTRSILDVASSLGIHLKKSGQSYTWTEHDSFVITPRRNAFYWNSRFIGGGPIQLVQLIKDCGIGQAVDYLQELDANVFDASKIPPKKPFQYFMKESTDLTLAKNYLINERKLSEETVNLFIDQDLIAQSTFTDKETGYTEPVIVFKHKDRTGKVQGVALQGIYENYDIHDRGRLKKTFGDGFTGLSIQVGNPPSFKDATEEKPLKIIAFEAPIDLMSYYELHKDTLGDAVLVSMNGLRKGTISKYLANDIAPNLPEEMKDTYLDELSKHFKPSKKVQIVLAVDNDPLDENKKIRPAQHFIETFNTPIFPVTYDVPELVGDQTKNDWNEQLKLVKSGAISMNQTQPEENNKRTRLKIAEDKLNRLENEFEQKAQEVFDHGRQTNGQPMNDKRGSQRYFKKQEQKEEAAFNKLGEIEKQRERVEHLKEQEELKNSGMNKQGGLIMSVDNIPRIKAEIEKAEAGTSLYKQDTIRKYKKKLVELEKMKEVSDLAMNNLTEESKELIHSGKVTQWNKQPTIYFVKGLKKVALELSTTGEFTVSEKYQPTTDEEKERVKELLDSPKKLEENNVQVINNENNKQTITNEPSNDKEQKNVIDEKESEQQRHLNNQKEESFNEEQIESLLNDSSASMEKTSENNFKAESVVSEVNENLVDFREDVDQILSEASDEIKQNLTQEDIQKILDEHMLKVEKVIQHYTNSFEKVEAPTEKDVQEVTTHVTDNVQSILAEFKQNLKEYLANKKNRAVGSVVDKMDDIRVGIKNSINGHILKVNQLIKNFATKIDKKFALEVKKSAKKIEDKHEDNPKKGIQEKEEPSLKLLDSKKQHREQLIDARNRLVASSDFLRSDKLEGEKLSPVQRVKMYDKKIKDLDLEIEGLEAAALVDKTEKASQVSNEKQPQAVTKDEKNELQELVGKNDIEGLTKYLDKKVTKLKDVDNFKKYLQAVSNFPKFSRSNIQLLMEQNQKATKVASVNKWKELGFGLKENAKEMFVRATYPTVKRDEQGQPMLDKDGELVKERQERLVPVFDVNEVIGSTKELNRVMESVKDLSAPQTFTKVFKTLTELSPAEVVLEQLPVEGRSIYNPDENKLSIQPGLGEEATIKELIDGISTIKLNPVKDYVIDEQHYQTYRFSDRHEFESMAVTYVVASHLGMDVNDFNFNYLKTNSMSTEEFIESLDKITTTANELVSKIDRQLEKSLTKNSPRNKFEERLQKANSVSEEVQQIKEKQENVDSPKVSSPSVSR
ncbi:LPD1 domain-containing protein [Enterococcus faecalis]|uniref:LPD1 domain-containing protein n=1 Tax=Enterococcus faecalis TaxID=1351 RepID=UPI000459690F|nr:LPD1 domain-containing protein [Enterococcus faecalis]KAJ85626.1 hypothetical protein P791_1225 [Enterococcus faecalis NY9]